MKYLQESIHALAEKKGWWKDGKVKSTFVEKLLMIHSEVSEATEELRTIDNFIDMNNLRFSADGKPEGFAIELADIVIRVLDLAEATNIDLGKAISLKNSYNATRPYRHGNKSL